MSKLTRTNNSDSMLAGVAGGLAKHFDVDPVISRLLWVIFLLASAGTAAIIYIIMMLVMPEEILGELPGETPGETPDK